MSAYASPDGSGLMNRPKPSVRELWSVLLGDSKLGRIDVIVRRVDPHYRHLDPVQMRAGIVVSARIVLVDDIVRIERRQSCRKIVVDVILGGLPGWRNLLQVQRRGSHHEGDYGCGPQAANRLLRIVPSAPLWIIASSKFLRAAAAADDRKRRLISSLRKTGAFGKISSHRDDTKALNRRASSIWTGMP